MQHKESKPVESIRSINANQIRADRACIHCGFNLYGQVVTKEPHYGLAIATCPECNTVAALQSYPTMSHWVNRFRALLAGLWIMMLLLVFVFQVTSIVTYASGVSSNIGMPLAKAVGEAYDNWLVSNGYPSNKANWGANSLMYYQWISVTEPWVDEHLDTVIEEAGGLWKLIEPSSAIGLIPASIGAFFAGVFWSIALLGASRARAALIPIIASMTAVLVVFGFANAGFVSWQAMEVARRVYLPWMIVPFVALSMPMLLLGVFLGRKIARGIIMLTLPPRLRVPFSIFWTRDGLELPKPTHA